MATKEDINPEDLGWKKDYDFEQWTVFSKPNGWFLYHDSNLGKWTLDKHPKKQAGVVSRFYGTLDEIEMEMIHGLVSIDEGCQREKTEK